MSWKAASNSLNARAPILTPGGRAPFAPSLPKEQVFACARVICVYDQRCVGGIPGAGTMPVYAFKDFEIDLERFELRREGEPVADWAPGLRCAGLSDPPSRPRDLEARAGFQGLGRRRVEPGGGPYLYRRGAQGARRYAGATRPDRHRPQTGVPVRGNGTATGRRRDIEQLRPRSISGEVPLGIWRALRGERARARTHGDGAGRSPGPTAPVDLPRRGGGDREDPDG